MNIPYEKILVSSALLWLPLLLVLCHRIVVNTIEQVQRCQNRQDLQLGQINLVGTVLLRAHQTCENRNSNERNALLKKAADRKPERRPCLNRKRAVFWSNVHERTPCFQIIYEFLTIQSHAKWKKNCESWLHEWAIFVEFHIARSNIEMQRKRNQDGVLNRYVYFMIPALT